MDHHHQLSNISTVLLCSNFLTVVISQVLRTWKKGITKYLIRSNYQFSITIISEAGRNRTRFSPRSLLLPHSSWSFRTLGNLQAHTHTHTHAYKQINIHTYT